MTKSTDTILTLISVAIVSVLSALAYVFHAFLPWETQKYIAMCFLAVMAFGAVVWLVKSFIFLALWTYGDD